ncbi:fimbrial protein [Salmonella enterica]|nr:fimbrial protein [Salmonella enterica]EGW2852190.1 fimbrial protein [Salmonella enterica]
MQIVKNHLSVLLALVITSSVTGSCMASSNDSGMITFTGSVNAHTCDITTNNGLDTTNVTLSMPVVTAEDITNTSLANGGVGEKEFELMLNCDAASGLTSAAISFSSPQFAELSSGTLKNDPSLSDGAKNVNVALFNNGNGNSSQVLIGRPDDVGQTITMDDTNHGGVFAYKAVYVPSADMDATANPVVAGSVSTNATFTVSYQ